MTVVKKYKVKVPNNVEILFDKKKNLICVKGPLGQKIFKLNLKLIINTKFKTIEITDTNLFLMSNDEKKKKKSYKGTYLSLLKQSFLEVSVPLFKKLKLVGIGFKVIVENILGYNFLIFKLGYSHNIYFKIPKNIKIVCLKSDTIFILGQSYHAITQVSAIIKSYKVPEPYKGKGILYENEKILLKEGKKI